MKDRKILAGNWKMNLLQSEARALVDSILQEMTPNAPPMILFTPSLYLAGAVDQIGGHPGIQIGGQHCYQGKFGAFTGEISAVMLRSCGVQAVLAGHSERRQYFGDSDMAIAGRLPDILAAGLHVIYCCGESLEVRQSGEHIGYVLGQIADALFGIDPNLMSNISIAYEPIWAIGTGLTASPEQAQEMHLQIRSSIQAHFGFEISESTSILYGGSANASNAAELFSQPDIDGGLIGGASLKSDSFLMILDALSKSR
ncbi:MAG: triose-phosphate isomerase [Saprospiraceae bacterium]